MHLKSKIDTINESIDQMRDSAQLTVHDIQANTDAATKTLDEAYSNLQSLAFLVPVAILVIYYIVYLIVKGFTYDFSVFGGVLIAVPIGLLLRFTIQSVYKDFLTKRDASIRSLATTQQGLGEFLAKHVKLDTGMKGLLESFGQVSLYGQKLASGVRDYLPGVKQYYDSRQRIVAQQNFSMTLRNALREYHFKSEGKADEYLLWFGPMTSTAQEWLDEATGSLGPLLETAPIILRLAYADYAGDLPLAKNCWVDVWNDKGLISELARTLIANEVVSTEYVENNLQSYGAIEELFHEHVPFRLDRFRSEYNRFYVDFVREKRALIDAISLYKFKSSLLIEDKIRKFVPSSLDEKKRLTELIEGAALEVGMPKEIVSLAFYEREALIQERIRDFETIRGHDHSGKSNEKRNRDLLSRLSDHLVTSSLIEVPTQYKEDIHRLTEFVSDSLSGLDDFTIAHANLEVRLVFGLLESEKNTFLRTLFANKILMDESDRMQFGSWLPEETGSDISRWLADRTGVPEDILHLFHLQYIQSERDLKNHFESLQSGGRLSVLSKILVERGIISLPQESRNENMSENLTLLLQKMGTYDLPQIEARFFIFNSLFEYSKSIIDFFKKENLAPENATVEFSSVMTAQVEAANGMIEKLFEIVRWLLSQYSAKDFTSAGWERPVSHAVLVLFLVFHEDVLSTEACKKAGQNERASLILYRYSSINEEEQQRGTRKTLFSAIIERTVTGTYNSYKYLESFKRELVGGFLYQRISHLLISRLDSIEGRLAERGGKRALELKLKKFEGALQRFLDSQFKPPIVLESLKMQLTSAFLITNPGSLPIITQLVDDYLPRVCNETAEKDPSFKDFLLLSESTVGRATRVGVVPFRMAFDEFSKRLDTLFHLAVSRYLEEHPDATVNAEGFSANVIRIFPSAAYFKRIGGRVFEEVPDESDNEHPINIVRKLMIDHFGHVDNLELLASLQSGEEKKIAMRSILVSFVDVGTTIYSIAGNELAEIVAGKLLEEMQSGRFDRILLTNTGCASLSQLALLVFRACSGNDRAILQAEKKKYESKIKDTISQTGARPSQKDLERASEIVFDSLFDIGMILQGHAEQ